MLVFDWTETHVGQRYMNSVHCDAYSVMHWHFKTMLILLYDVRVMYRW